MSEELRAILNDDGVFEEYEYDDTFDLSIHCVNEEEQKEILNRLNRWWIPVSERLPEYGESVLTVDSDDEYEINHIIDEELDEWFYDGVVAWMPLPEPYKAEKEEE